MFLCNIRAIKNWFLSWLKGMTFHNYSNISSSFSIKNIPLFQLPAFEANSYPPQPARRFKRVTIFNLAPSLHYHPHILPLCLLVVCITTYLYPFAIKRIYTISGKNLLLDHCQKIESTSVSTKFQVGRNQRWCHLLQAGVLPPGILCQDKAGYIVDIGGKK